MFNVTKNIPIPKKDSKPRHEKIYNAIAETFSTMEVGDSFDVSNELSAYATLKTKIKELLSPLLKKGEGYKYIALKEEGKVIATRIWKVEKKDQEDVVEGESESN